MKNATVRVNETIDYIASRVPPAEKNAMDGYLHARVQAVVGTGPIKGISDPMSMNDLANRGTDVERKKRRAIMLLETVVLTASPTATGAKNLAPGALDGRLNPLLDAARLLCDQNCGTANLLQGKFIELRNNPLAFLQNNLVLVFGSNTNGPMVQYFVFEYAQGVGKFKFVTARPGVATHCYAPQVVNIPAVLWSSVPGRTNVANAGSFAGIVGTHLTVASTMVTTQFSGCSLCFRNAGGAVYAAHIWPDDANVPNSALPVGPSGHGGGTRLAEQLAGLEAPGVAAAGFAAPAPGGPPAVSVYGPGYSNIAGHAAGYPVRVGNDWTTMLGFDRAGTWEIWSQEVVNAAIAHVVRVL